MNIIVTTLLDPDKDKNGVISVARDLNLLLSGDGHALQLITPVNGKNGSAGERVASLLKRITGRLHRATGSPLFYLAGLRLTLWNMKLRIAELAGSCDALIAHDPLSASAALQASATLKLPVILLCHFWTEPWIEFSSAGLLPEGNRGFSWLKRQMQNVLNDSRITLVAVSERNAALLRQIVPHCDPERIMISYPGVTPCNASSPAVNAEDRLPVVINVGKIEKRKNQRVLPMVASELVRLGRSCRFVLTGPEVPEEKKFICSELLSNGVDPLFRMTGQFSREQVLDELKKADIYLHTSLMESFGMTLVEAMAAGTPVVALEYEALREILPDTPEAIIPASASPAEIAAKLDGLLGNRPLLDDIQARQSAVFKQRFSSKAFLARILEILEAARKRSKIC